MRSKNEILVRLDELRTVREDVDDLFSPLIRAVEKYFTGDSQLTHDVQYTIHQLTQDFMARKTFYENQSLLPPFPENYPKGYENVRELFDGGGSFEKIMTVSIEDFEAAYVFEEPTHTQPPVINTFLVVWLAELEAARSKELDGLGAVSAFCESTGFNCGLAHLFESLGEIISSPGTSDLVKRIYQDGGYKEIIKAFGINVYIPTTA